MCKYSSTSLESWNKWLLLLYARVNQLLVRCSL